jgi:hypothetical protein
MKAILIGCLVVCVCAALAPHAFACVLVSDDEIAFIKGGGCCTAICETWWCPDGNKDNINCDGLSCIGGGCGCSQYKEQVSRVGLPENGTGCTGDGGPCGPKYDCDCKLDIQHPLGQCKTTADRCGTGDEQWGLKNYIKCLVPPKK